MKHLSKISSLFLFICFTFQAHAVFVQHLPVNRIQPNGDTIHFFVTGDEYYHRYHDADGYTLVMDADGYWVYAMPSDDGGIQPSPYRFGSVAPASLGILANLTISRQQWEQHQKSWEIPEQYRRVSHPKSGTRNRGGYANLVIFIRFADDTGYTRTISSMESMFSDSSSSSANSVYNYFRQASYGKLFVHTHYAPEPDGNTIRSYQSPHPRSYFMPYSSSNPNGYRDEQRAQREFDLLASAVNYVNQYYPVPSDVELDYNGDGEIDNVNFIVKGSYTAWSDLLWPHKWNLYGRDVRINGKIVNVFNFQLEGSGADYFGTSTFCHEMFHSLGAPDLYHYYARTDLTPAGSWDVMATTGNPPQHMSTYMKWRYGNWIDSIPTITEAGRYTVSSVSSSNHYYNNCYKIPSSDSNQFYVLEYRNKSDAFEESIPASGLLVWHIDTRFEGNAGYDGNDYLNEVWVFRPGSASQTENGYLGQAAFNSSRGRGDFSPTSDPHPHFSDGTPDYSFAITNITPSADRLVFVFTTRLKPYDLSASNATTYTCTLKWQGNANRYLVRYWPLDDEGDVHTRQVSASHATITGLQPNARYGFSVQGVYPNASGGADSSKVSDAAFFHTMLCNDSRIDTTGVDGSNDSYLPFAPNAKYSYTQQLIHSDKFSGPATISSISFYYDDTEPLTRSNCTIYLANTYKEAFDGVQDVVPDSLLTRVFCGEMTLGKGWNEFIFDSPFYRPSDANLLVAIDDNSGNRNQSSNHFAIQSTGYNSSISYYSSTQDNPGPDTLCGSRKINQFHNRMLFIGCPDNGDKKYFCVISDNEEMGHVSNSGLYDVGEVVSFYAFAHHGYRFSHWNDGNNSETRSAIIASDTLFIAFFSGSTGIQQAESICGGYFVSTQCHRITVAQAEGEIVQLYDLMGRRLAVEGTHHTNPVVFDVPQSGIYLLRVGNDKPVKIHVN